MTLQPLVTAIVVTWSLAVVGCTRLMSAPRCQSPVSRPPPWTRTPQAGWGRVSGGPRPDENEAGTETRNVSANDMFVQFNSRKEGKETLYKAERESGESASLSLIP